MNQSTQSTFIQAHAAALMRLCRQAMGCLLWVMGAGLLLAQPAWALSGTVCLPRGFLSFSAINPNVVTLKANKNTDQLLYAQSATDTSTNSACTTNPFAELYFNFQPNTFFSITDMAAEFSSNTANLIKVSYKIRTNSSDVFADQSSMYVKYTITMACKGGLSAFAPSNNELVIRGVNSRDCDANFTLNYQIEIYQFGSRAFKTNYQKITPGTGFQVITEIRSQGQQAGSGTSTMTRLPDSGNTAFQSSLDCKYTLSKNSIDFGFRPILDVFNNAPIDVFTIRVFGCNNGLTTGSGRSHAGFVYWTFEAVDPGNPTILANTNTASDASVNAGVRISCTDVTGWGVEIKDKSTVNLFSSISGNLSTATCSVRLAPTSNVVNVSDIKPGRFTSRATLTFQFN